MTDLNANFIGDDTLNADFIDDRQINAQFGDVTIVESGDYEKIINHPFINDEEVVGRKTLEDYGVKTLTNIEIKQLFDRVFTKGE